MPVGSMFSRPVETLGFLKERPRWLFPLLIAAAYPVAVNFYVIYRVGFARLMSAVAQVNAALDPQAVLDAAMARKGQILCLQGVSTAVGTILTALVVAKVLWLILTLAGRDVTFKRVIAVVAHVTMLAAVLKQSMLALTVTMMRNLEQLDLRNPLATNPAFFLHPSSPAASRLLASADAVTFANIYLIAVGLTKISNRLSLRTACILVAVPWGIYTGASLLLPSSS